MALFPGALANPPPHMALKEPLDYKEHVERDNFLHPEIFKQPKLQ